MTVWYGPCSPLFQCCKTFFVSFMIICMAISGLRKRNFFFVWKEVFPNIIANDPNIVVWFSITITIISRSKIESVNASWVLWMEILQRFIRPCWNPGGHLLNAHCRHCQWVCPHFEVSSVLHTTIQIRHEFWVAHHIFAATIEDEEKEPFCQWFIRIRRWFIRCFIQWNRRIRYDVRTRVKQGRQT